MNQELRGGDHWCQTEWKIFEFLISQIFIENFSSYILLKIGVSMSRNDAQIVLGGQSHMDGYMTHVSNYSVLKRGSKKSLARKNPLLRRCRL